MKESRREYFLLSLRSSYTTEPTSLGFRSIRTSIAEDHCNQDPFHTQKSVFSRATHGSIFLSRVGPGQSPDPAHDVREPPGPTQPNPTREISKTLLTRSAPTRPHPTHPTRPAPPRPAPIRPSPTRPHQTRPASF